MAGKVTERQIILGSLVSLEYMQQVRSIFDVKYLRADASQRICRWAIEFYDKYNKVMGEDITELYMDKVKKEHIPDEIAEQIENILESLSDEFDREVFNFEYIADKTEEYFKTRAIELHQEQVQILLDNGDTEEAAKLIESFVPPKRLMSNGIDLSDPSILDKLEQAFQEAANPLFKIPGPAGELINEFLLRGGFVVFDGPEKRGKTWTLMEMAMRAAKANCNVAFFQAGDMSENQQLRRIAIYRAMLSDKEQYTGWQWVPYKDCIHQQLDTCVEKQRQCEIGLFGNEVKSREDITAEMLKQASEEVTEYSPCRNCSKFKGTVYLKKENLGSPMTYMDAQREFTKFFIKKGRRFKLDSYPSGTLSMKMVEAKLDEWEKQGFIADVIVLDYMSLMTSAVKEVRHAQNDIYMDARGLAQKKHLLFISADQADAESYDTDTITMKNFSEDKRKNAHPTVKIGLNQDRKGREKGLGILRWNIILAREADFNPMKCVNLVQSLKQGRALITSYW